MNKIWLIIKREYWSRVSKRTFLFTTLGLPILMVGFSALIGFMAAKSGKDYKVAIVDPNNKFEQSFELGKRDQVEFLATNQWPSIKDSFMAKDFDMLLYIDPNLDLARDSNAIVVYSESNLSFEINNDLGDKINEKIRANILNSMTINTVFYDSINQRQFPFVSVTKDKNSSNSAIAFGIGYAMCLLIYMVIFIYGSMVMRGVMEEKTNRIAEVIISSVKPFQLMMGKILGIALVGLTQFLIWGIFMLIITAIISLFAAGKVNPADITSITSASGTPSANLQFLKVQDALKGINFGGIFFAFVFYFLGGYFLYASLFAVAGSMVNEDAAEAQSLTLPITMPIVIALVIGMQAARDPNSGLAVFGSIFPLTSPIVMMTRIAYHPPLWQIALSVALLLITFIATTWIAAKIYRTSILMYGKKLSWKEVIKWI
jgi:ABC-2 type transport system permease protein